MNSLEDHAGLKALLARLHAQSDAQTPALARFIRDHGYRSVSGSEADLEKGRSFWRDKLVAFEPDKARFCYMLCRAMDARCVVEVGTSFGVSTLYLAAALRDNGGGQVIATEIEPEKAAIARAHFEAAGLSAYVDLRDGDLRQTLRGLHGPVDFCLMDIWTPLARAAIEHIGPQMRLGGSVVADNSDTYRIAYGDYFAYLADPANGFSTQTLPFDGGLELSVKTGQCTPAT